MKIKTGDDVIILSGKNKGQTGRVERILRKKEMIVVKGVNVVKRHMRPRRDGEKGVIAEITKPVPASVVSLIEENKPIRVKYSINNGKKVRVSAKSGKEI